MRYVILTIFGLPALIQLIVIINGSFHLLGIKASDIYYKTGGELSGHKILIGLLISVLSFLIGVWYFQLKKTMDKSDNLHNKNG